MPRLMFRKLTESERIVWRLQRGRILRKVLLSLLIVAIVAGLCMWWAYRAAGKVPEWYVPPDIASTQSIQEAHDAEGKIADVQTWAAAKHAYESARQYGTPLAKPPAEELIISFSQAEVNSFVSKWYGRFGPQSANGRRLNDVFRGPMVRIERERITLAGAVPPLNGRIVSLDVQPVVEGGGLNLKLLSVRTGNLPLPEFTWAKPRQMIIDSLTDMLGKLRAEAAIDRAGAANPEAVSSVMAIQGVDTLQHRITENVLFVPVSEKTGLPVKLKSCDLQDGMITLTTQPLEKKERDALLYKLRGGTNPDKVPIYLTPGTRSTR